MTTNKKRVIIIGASYGGILALKTLLGTKKCHTNHTLLDITIIAPNDQTYFNIASPRLLTELDLTPKVVFKIKDVITKLSSGTEHAVKFVQGTVKNVDLDDKSLTISNSDKIFGYDNLIIASGTRTDFPGFKLDNERDQNYSLEAIKTLAKEIEIAKSIAIIGGGSTGVEVAGELGYKYGKQKEEIVLYTGASRPLLDLPENQSLKAARKLEQLGITIVNNDRAKVSGNSVLLTDGSTAEYSLVIKAYSHIPNTEFLSAEVLNEKGYIITDNQMRLTKYPEVICLGDVLEIGLRSVVDLVYAQKSVFESTVQVEVFGSTTKSKTYTRPSSTTMVVPIGKEGGVGMAFGWNVPNFLVSHLKAKDFMISHAGDNLS
ncbi:Apoptosis-inducing factor 2 [Spathaspora sp. JA1]|nr:Apoptosis-inducing factor 2 [Spathaspora sp. JA1]